MLNEIKEDYKRISIRSATCCNILIGAVVNAGFRAVFLYRIGYALRKSGFRILAALVERVMHHACYCWISTAAVIGKGFLVAHVGGIIIGGGVKMGENCDIRQNVTIGGNFSRTDRDGRTQPVIEEGVSICSGAAILGPVRIGANTIIGSNSVVTIDMPSNCIVSGIPANVIKQRWAEHEGRRL